MVPLPEKRADIPPEHLPKREKRVREDCRHLDLAAPEGVQLAVPIPPQPHVVAEAGRHKRKRPFLDEASLLVTAEEVAPLSESRLEIEQAQLPRVLDEKFVEVPAGLETRLGEDAFVTVDPILHRQPPTATLSSRIPSPPPGEGCADS